MRSPAVFVDQHPRCVPVLHAVFLDTVTPMLYVHCFVCLCASSEDAADVCGDICRHFQYQFLIGRQLG